MFFMALISAFAITEYREVQYLSDVSVAERSNDDKSYDDLAPPPIEHVQVLEGVLQEIRKEQRMMRKKLARKEDKFIYDDHQSPWQGKVKRECNDLDEYYLWPWKNNTSQPHGKGEYNDSFK